MIKKRYLILTILVMCLIFAGICLIFVGLNSKNSSTSGARGDENGENNASEVVDNSRLPIKISSEQRVVANEAAFVDFLVSELKQGNNTVVSEYFALDAFNERGYYFIDDDMTKLDSYMKTYERDIKEYDEYIISSVMKYKEYSIVNVVLVDQEVANQEIKYNYQDMDVLYFTVFHNDDGLQVIPFLLSQTVYYLYDIGAIEFRNL